MEAIKRYSEEFEKLKNDQDTPILEKIAKMYLLRIGRFREKQWYNLFLFFILIVVILAAVLVGVYFEFKIRSSNQAPPTPSATISPTCIPRPACLDQEPRCLMPETEDMCLPTVTKVPKDDGVACTQEAKLCPDGSYVGRTGPSCEFTPCPGD